MRQTAAPQRQTTRSAGAQIDGGFPIVSPFRVYGMMFSTATWPPAPSGKDLRKGVGLKTIMTAMGEAVAEIGAMTRAAFLVYLGLANGIAPSVTSAFHAKTVWGPIVFRRKIGARVWHSSPECFSWPKTNFEEKE